MAYSYGCLCPKRSLSVAEMWRSKRQTSTWIHETRKEIHYNLVASCLPKLHSDPTFSIVLFSPLGPQTGCGAVPGTLETPRHSPPLRSRPRDALFCIASTIKCINASCNPVRLLEAAELLEADQHKHEGGHSKAQGEAQAKLYNANSESNSRSTAPGGQLVF